jgi:hypothetical protein
MVDRINCQHKEERGQRIALPKAAAVLNGVTRHAIEEDSRSRGGEECPNPIPEFSREATMLEKIHEVVPSHGVESLFDVKLEEEARCFGAMKFASKVPHIHVVIVDASFFDECALGIGHKRVHMRRKPSGHHLCNILGNGMDKAYRSIVRYVFGTIFLRD